MKLYNIAPKNDIIVRVREGESINTLCQKYSTKREHVHCGDIITAGQWIHIAKSYKRMHVVRPLENLTKICAQYNVTPAEVISANELKTANLFIGQRLVID